MSSLLLRRFALIVLAVVVLLGAWVVRPDAPAREQVQQGLQRALISFAAARTLSAVLSLAEGTAVQAAPFGIGVELTPGRILRPLNELSEQFSTLMLAASVAFGIQLFLLQIGAHWVLSALLSAALLVWLAMRLADVDPASRASRFASTALLALLLARFAVPLSALASEGVFRQVLAAPQQEALATVERSGRELSLAQPEAGGKAVQGASGSGASRAEIGTGSGGAGNAGSAGSAGGAGSNGNRNAPAVAASPDDKGAAPLASLSETETSRTGVSSLWDALRQKLPAVPSPQAAYQRMRDAVERAVDQIVRMIAIFVIQTVVLPLAFLWMLLALGRSLVVWRGGGQGSLGSMAAGGEPKDIPRF